jgi:hypothetical protein
LTIRLQARVHLEAEAVLLILGHIEAQEDWVWVGSEVLWFELSRIPDEERRRRIDALLQFMSGWQEAGPAVGVRANELHGLGFKAIDALHIACAETSNCDVVLTSDDRMLGMARRSADHLRVRIENPVNWLGELNPT